jgi:hypothetical protein
MQRWKTEVEVMGLFDFLTKESKQEEVIEYYSFISVGPFTYDYYGYSDGPHTSSESDLVSVRVREQGNRVAITLHTNGTCGDGPAVVARYTTKEFLESSVCNAMAEYKKIRQEFFTEIGERSRRSYESYITKRDAAKPREERLKKILNRC